MTRLIYERIYAYSRFSLSKQKMMTVKVFIPNTDSGLKCFSCNLQEGPIISLQGGNKNIITLQKLIFCNKKFQL